MNRVCGGGLWLALTVVIGCAGSEAEPAPAAPSRVAELLSIARVQDPASVGTLEQALRNGTPPEREVAAFGLGQLGVAWEPPPDAVRESAARALISALLMEREAAVRDRVIEALGKVGGKDAFETLVPLVDDDGAGLPAAERERAAVALALIARSSQGELVSPRARDAMVLMLEEPDPSVRFAGAYGLLRYRDPETLPAFLAGLGDEDPHVRSTCLKALVTLGSLAEVPAIAPLLEDADDRVAAEAARTLIKLAIKCTTNDCPALDALVAVPGPFRPAVMQALSFEGWISPSALPLFQARFDEYAQATTLDPRERALLQCQAAMAHDRAAGELMLLADCGSGVLDDVERDVLVARALAWTSGPEIAALLQSEATVVRIAATAGARVAALPALLADPDPIVVGAAASRAEAIEATEVALDLVQALDRLQISDAPADALEGQLALLSAVGALGVEAAAARAEALLDAEPYALRQAAAHTLTQLTGEPREVRLPERLDAAPLLEPTTVRIGTTRGTIRIRLFADDAPRTAHNFVELVKSGFYDGIAVHRVVPNFVSQAGDPRGDGSGGPGYAIPCEINLQRYGEGTVGMALAGRDTGGSQFFVAHSPQPHLDGLYTTFGEVVEGLDVASGLLEGDVIEEARVE